MRKKYGTVSNPEDKLGLTVNITLVVTPAQAPLLLRKRVQPNMVICLSPNQNRLDLQQFVSLQWAQQKKVDFIEKIISALAVDSVFELVKKLVVSMLAKNVMAGLMKLVENILEHLLTKLDDSTVGSFWMGWPTSCSFSRPSTGESAPIQQTLSHSLYKAWHD